MTQSFFRERCRGSILVVVPGVGKGELSQWLNWL
jgi:hypothetical protein